MGRIRTWLDETHSAGFELARHFFLRFFESDFVATPGQLKIVAASAVGLIFSIGFVFVQSYYHKYLELATLDDPQPYRLALIADVLFLDVLSMVGMGLFTTLQWPSLFPGLRDYLALAALPVRMREIFTAKLAALFTAAVLFTVVSNLLPAMVLPMVAAGRWSQHILWQIPGIFLSTSLAALFVFFCLVAVQGVLLNILPVRQFARVSLAVQGVLLTVLLASLSLVFSIPSAYRSMTLRPAWAMAAPPLWFLGIDQVVVQNSETFAVRLAVRGLLATSAAAAAALAAYAWSYRRHRKRIIESPEIAGSGSRIWTAATAQRLIPSTRRLAVFAFIAKTLARSREHRLILTGFVAIAAAVIFEGFLTLTLDRSSGGFQQAVLAVPLALSLFVLGGLRYLFRLPVELRANWVFRIHEPGFGLELLAGMEDFLFCCALAPVAVLSLPVEVMVFGLVQGLAAAILTTIPSLILMEALLFSFDRIPFTSSYLPGRRPLIETSVAYSSFAAGWIWGLASLTRRMLPLLPSAVILAAVLLAAWLLLRRTRLSLRTLGRLEFEELPETAVMVLDLDND